MTTSLAEDFDLVAHSSQLLPRLKAGEAELAKVAGLSEEKSWIALAHERLSVAREPTGDLLVRALRIPELTSKREEHARVLQNAAIDALEHLHASIIFVGGQRSPLLEALYFKLKLPVLRKCDRDELERFFVDFEKRLGSSYTKRMLADADYAPVVEAVSQLRKTFDTWRGIFIAPPLEESAAETLRQELRQAARRLEVATRQARMLALAALAPLGSAVDAQALIGKPKRKGRSDDETHPILEQDPADPAEPTVEERAEVEALHEETSASG